MKRSPLNRRTPMTRSSSTLRRTPIAPVSARRRSETTARRATIDAVIARDGRRCCAADIVPEIACAGPLDADEWELRSARPGGHLDSANVQMLCRMHHDWKHAHPIDAAHAGLRPYPAGYLGERIEHARPGDRR